MLVWFEAFRITGVTDVMPRRSATATAARMALSCLSLCVTMSSQQSPPNVDVHPPRRRNAEARSGATYSCAVLGATPSRILFSEADIAAKPDDHPMARVRQPRQEGIVVSDDQLCWELRIDGCVSIAHQRHVEPKADRPTTGR